jgi:hypothetical protein
VLPRTTKNKERGRRLLDATKGQLSDEKRSERRQHSQKEALPHWGSQYVSGIPTRDRYE